MQPQEKGTYCRLSGEGGLLKLLAIVSNRVYTVPIAREAILPAGTGRSLKASRTFYVSPCVYASQRTQPYAARPR